MSRLTLPVQEGSKPAPRGRHRIANLGKVLIEGPSATVFQQDHRVAIYGDDESADVTKFGPEFNGRQAERKPVRCHDQA
jgi:hypothetical protein